jgi:glycosyltransferase involved in cell wall biosynthesis
MANNHPPSIGVWFPTIRTGTGTDSFTISLAESLNQKGIYAEITWFPHRAEYLPWTVPVPEVPSWASIVHINSWMHERFIPRHYPLVVTLHGCVHDHELISYKSFLQDKYHKYWVKMRENYAISMSSVAIAVSNYTAEKYKESFGSQDIQVIYNGVNLEKYSPDLRKKPHYPFRLLFAGKPSNRKGSDLLPEIMRSLGSDFELWITCTAKDFDNGELFPDNIKFLGRIFGDQAMASTYKRCDALLFPTRLEGMSLAVLEAQACGLPVIATNAASMPEIVKDGQTGFLSAVDDTKFIANAAIRLRKDPHQWQIMKTAAREYMETHFDENSTISRYIGIYEDVLRS